MRESLDVLSDRELKLRREILLAFAATGAPPQAAFYATRHEELAALEEQHVILLRDGRIWAAFPFAAHERARIRADDGREWWGNCPWDAFGIVAALGLERASVDVDGITIGIADGEVAGDAWFHVVVPAAHWWDDIEFT